MTYALRNRVAYAATAVSIVLVAWLYLLPLGSRLDLSEVWRRIQSEDVGLPLWRSIVVAAVSAPLSVALGFSAAVGFRKLPLQSRGGQALAFLMLSMFVGDLVDGIAFKSLATPGSWFQALFANREPFKVMTAMIAIQVWQQSSLCTYLFWLRIAH